jgi:hypothetical protein
MNRNLLLPQVWRLRNLISRCYHLVRALLMHHHIVEDERIREREREREILIEGKKEEAKFPL